MTAQMPSLPGKSSAQRRDAVRGDRIRIGALAKLTGVTVETIRYYEKRGLIVQSARLASGYREFPMDAIRQVQFVGRAQALGFSLAEVEQLAELRRQAWAGDATAQLRTAAVEKLHDVEGRIRELRGLQRELASLIADCDKACPVDSISAGNSNVVASQMSDCPLVEALDGSEMEQRPMSSRRSRASSDVRGTHAQAEPSTRRGPLRARGTKSSIRRTR